MRPPQFDVIQKAIFQNYTNTLNWIAETIAAFVFNIIVCILSTKF